MTASGPVAPQARMQPDLSVEVIGDRQQLSALASSWDVLWRESGPDTVFLSQDWLLPWWDRQGAGKELRVLLVREGREPIGLAPWCVEATWGCRRLRTMGHGFIDYEGVLAGRERGAAVAAALREWLGASCGYDEAVFERLPIEGSIVAEGERAQGADSGMVAPCTDLSQGWEALVDRLSHRFRSDTARQIRRLSEAGPLSLRIVEGQEELEGAFGPFLEWKLARHRRRYQGEDPVHGTGGFWGEAGVADYYREVATRLLAKRRLAFSRLDVGGRMVSAVFGLEKDGVFHYFAPAFDPDYEACSVGRVHVWLLMQDLCRRGFRRFDFLVGDEPYKRDWLAQPRPLAQMRRRRAGLSWILGMPPRILGVLERRRWWQRSYRWMKERVAL